MFIQVALTVTFRRNQVQTVAFRPAWLMTFTVYLRFLHQTSQQYLQLDQNHLLPLVFEFIIYQSSYHSMPYWILTAWSSKDEINLSLPTPLRHIGRAEVQLHSFLTLALQGGKPQPHALTNLSSVTMLYELQNVERYVHTLQVIIKAGFDQEFPTVHLIHVQCWLHHLLKMLHITW